MYILNLSYGKDSTACLWAIQQLGWPLDRIITADVWATDTIQADPPPMVDFKAKLDEYIKKEFGIEVEHLYKKDKDGEKVTYEKVFYKERKFAKNGNSVHKIHGWPFRKGPWCNDRLKTGILDKVKGLHYIGIAADEPGRLARLGENKSPIAELGWTEKDCWKICEEHDMLSPIYKTSKRGGCWFCHNQSVEQLRLLRKTYPELWNLMLKWDEDSPVTFHADGHTVHDFDKRFEIEETLNKSWRWKYLEVVI